MQKFKLTTVGVNNALDSPTKSISADGIRIEEVEGGNVMQISLRKGGDVQAYLNVRRGPGEVVDISGIAIQMGLRLQED